MKRENKNSLLKNISRGILTMTPETFYEKTWSYLPNESANHYKNFDIESRFNVGGKYKINPEDCDSIKLFEDILVPHAKETQSSALPLELFDRADYMYLCHYKKETFEKFFQDNYPWVDLYKTNDFYNWFNLSHESLFKKEYTGIFIFIIVASLISAIMILLAYVFSAHNPETEKLSTYECGFEPYEDARHTISINFCIIAVLFIIFDIEIIYLIPWSVSLSSIPSLGFWSMMEFIIELGVGIFYIWIVRSLEWD